jgi:hypothetical protein
MMQLINRIIVSPMKVAFLSSCNRHHAGLRTIRITRTYWHQLTNASAWLATSEFFDILRYHLGGRAPAGELPTWSSWVLATTGTWGGERMCARELKGAWCFKVIPAALAPRQNLQPSRLLQPRRIAKKQRSHLPLRFAELRSDPGSSAM